ncbi:antimicrobial peptide THP1-like [Strix uralensis]|uniref:antimicrobial peptide THP1-like n=1 Tax=Strix uralensis TaxID=36305 RepID=UPI003DA79F39
MKCFQDMQGGTELPTVLKRKPREDPGQTSAMKILYLLFPFFLLLVQDVAGGVIGCRLRRRFCAPGRCPLNSRPIGRCSSFQACCKSTWG